MNIPLNLFKKYKLNCIYINGTDFNLGLFHLRKIDQKIIMKYDLFGFLRSINFEEATVNWNKSKKKLSESFVELSHYLSTSDNNFNLKEIIKYKSNLLVEYIEYVDQIIFFSTSNVQFKISEEIDNIIKIIDQVDLLISDQNIFNEYYYFWLVSRVLDENTEIIKRSESLLLVNYIFTNNIDDIKENIQAIAILYKGNINFDLSNDGFKIKAEIIKKLEALSMSINKTKEMKNLIKLVSEEEVTSILRFMKFIIYFQNNTQTFDKVPFKNLLSQLSSVNNYNELLTIFNQLLIEIDMLIDDEKINDLDSSTLILMDQIVETLNPIISILEKGINLEILLSKNLFSILKGLNLETILLSKYLIFFFTEDNNKIDKFITSIENKFNGDYLEVNNLMGLSDLEMEVEINKRFIELEAIVFNTKSYSKKLKDHQNIIQVILEEEGNNNIDRLILNPENLLLKLNSLFNLRLISYQSLLVNLSSEETSILTSFISNKLKEENFVEVIKLLNHLNNFSKLGYILSASDNKIFAQELNLENLTQYLKGYSVF